MRDLKLGASSHVSSTNQAAIGKRQSTSKTLLDHGPVLNQYTMSPPHLRLVELLGCDGVSCESKAVLMTILRRCASPKSLESFTLQSIDEFLQRQDHTFSLSTLSGLAGCERCNPNLACAQLRGHILRLVAEGLNIEAARWMSDFLLLGN
jgi:hypothetical protein